MDQPEVRRVELMDRRHPLHPSVVLQHVTLQPQVLQRRRVRQVHHPGGPADRVRHPRAAVTRSVIDAMQEAGVRRLLIQSSLGAGDSGAQLPVPLRQLMKVLLAKPLADHNEQETAVRGSGLDWTIVRPTGLRDTPPTGRWRAHEAGDGVTLGGAIPRIDLAAFMLETLSSPDAVGRSYGVSS